MKLSVVIPTYNRKDSLLITLNGLTQQTFPAEDFEVIVISDGSTDGTDELLASYAKTSPYTLRAITQSNAGPSRARNRGIQEAHFDVVVFIDDDVEPSPGFLAVHASHHFKNDRIAVLGPLSPDPEMSTQEPAWIAWEHAKLQDIYNMFKPGGEWYGAPAAPFHFYSGNASVRTEWLRAVNGFDEYYTRQEDVELAVRLERECGMKFEFDFAANGIHRPHRTFESWLRIPKAYGSFDASRIEAGLLNWSDIEANINKRNPATRFLSWLCRVCPFVLPAIVGTLKQCAVTLYRLGTRSPALAALSALYNVCYVSAATKALPAAK